MANFFKNHYQIQHQDHIQNDQHYHQSYILANVESIPAPVQQQMIPVTVPTSGEVELIQVPEPVMCYSDWFHNAGFQTVPQLGTQLQILQPNQFQILHLSELPPSNIIQTQVLEVPNPNVSSPILQSQPKRKKTNDIYKSCRVKVAKKSLPGSVPPPEVIEEDLEGYLECFICGPELSFINADALRIHCRIEHNMTSYVQYIQDTLPNGGNKLIKCQFCSYRTLEKNKYLNHLVAHHTPEDIYVKCLKIHSGYSRELQIRVKRKNKRVFKISLLCSLCEHVIKGEVESAKAEMRTHLVQEHKLIRNIDLGLSHCLPSLYTLPLT